MVGFELAVEDGISGDLRDRQWERVLQADWECGRPVGFGGMFTVFTACLLVLCIADFKAPQDLP